MAASDATPVPVKNQAFRFTFSIRKADGSLVTTWAGMDSEISKDGAAFTDCTNEATEIGTSGIGYLELTASETNCSHFVVKVSVTNTGALVHDFHFHPTTGSDIPVNTAAISGDTVAADNAEAFFDGTGYAGTNNVIPLVTTVSGVTGLTTATISDAVWDEPSGDHVAAGSTGQKLSAAGSASDPLLNEVPGSYASGTAGNALGVLYATNVVNVYSAVTVSEDIEIVRGSSYMNADSRAVGFNLDGSVPSLTGGSCRIRAWYKTPEGRGTGEVFLNKAGTVDSSTSVRFDITSAESSLFTPGRWQYELEVTTSGGNTIIIIPPSDGVMIVKESVR